jgi:PKD repeat protein
MDRLCLVIAMLASIAGCASKDAATEKGASPPNVRSRLKAETTATQTATETATATHTFTATQTATEGVTITQTVTNTVTATSSATFTTTQTVTNTLAATATQTASATQTVTATNTSTTTRTASAPGTYQQIYTFTGTITATSTAIVYYASWPHSQGNTATATTNQFASGTGITTVTRTLTSPFGGTQTKTASATVTGSGTKTGTATVTVTATVTSATTNAGTGTRTVTATGTASGTATQTWTATWTVRVTETVTNTTTSTVTSTGTVTNTTTVVNTITLTQTSTQTSTTSSTSTATGTNTATGSGTKTITATNTGTDTVTTTVTVTVTNTDTSTSVDGGTGICLQDWRNTTCGQACVAETQEDRKHCKDFLDCYLQNGCGPSTCGAQDDVCGVNKFTYGMAPKIIADQVYACLGCGSAPTCATIDLVATKQFTPPGTVDGNRTFATPVSLYVPRLLPVTTGSAGNGSATLSLQVAGSCPTCWQHCAYHGLAYSSHPTTPDQVALGRLYGLTSCDSGINPANPILVKKLSLHIDQSDALAGPTAVQLIKPCATDNGGAATPAPPTLLPEPGTTDPPISPGAPQPTDPSQPPRPYPYLERTNPLVNGVYIPQENPNEPIIEIPL